MFKVEGCPGDSFHIAVLVEAADLTDWDRVCSTAADLVLPVVQYSRGLPDGLIDAVLRSDDPVLIAALLHNEEGLADRPELADRLVAVALGHLDDDVIHALLLNKATRVRPDVRERLADTGKPRVVHKLYVVDGTPWSLLLQRRVAAAAHHISADDEKYLYRADGRAIHALVVCPVPRVVRRVLDEHGERLTLAEQLRAVLSIHEHGGGAAGVRGIGTGAELRPEVAELVRELVTTGDAGPLRDAVERAEGTAGAIEELYDPSTSKHADHLDLRAELDWDAIAEADGRDRFGEAASAALAARADCPWELRVALFTRHPTAVIRQITQGHPADWECVRALDARRPLAEDEIKAVVSHDDCPEDLRIALYGRHPAAVAEHTASPGAVLLAADCPPGRRAAATGILVRRGLNSGTLAVDEMMAQARPAWAALGAARAASWEVRFSGKLDDLVAQRLGSDVRVWAAVAARLEMFPGTIRELLDEAGSIAETEQGASARLAIEPARDEGADRADGIWSAFVSLLDAAPSKAHAALFPHLSDRALRGVFRYAEYRRGWAAHIAAPGRIQDAWRRVSQVPPEAAGRRRPLRKLAASPTAEQHRRMVYEMNQVQGRIPQSRVILDAWERFGADAVPDLLRSISIYSRKIYRKTLAFIEDLLDRHDPDTALERLRAEVTHGESAEGQIEAWRTRKDLAKLSEETQVWDWGALLCSHREKPFPPKTVWWMARVSEAPDVLRAEVSGMLPPGVCKAFTRLTAGDPAEPVLTDHAADEPRNRPYENWLETAVRAGKVTWAQALEHGHPVQVVLHEYWGRSRSDNTELAALMRDIIKGDTDAWIRAARMASDFPGSVAALLQAAADTG